MTAAPLHFGQARLMLDPSGALVWPEAGLLAVADLHLEKATAAARRGSLIPPWDSRITLDRLTVVLRHWQPRIVVALGDSFHDRNGAARLPASEAARLRAITAAHDFVWVAGNHDPEPPRHLGGVACSEFRHRDLAFRHQSADRPLAQDYEISGHFHPKARVVTRAGSISRPCFATSRHRVVLPAFGAYAGGLDVSHPALATLLPRGSRVFLLGHDRVFSFPIDRTERDGREPAAISHVPATAARGSTGKAFPSG